MGTWNSGSFIGQNSIYPEFERTIRMSDQQSKITSKGKIKNFNSFVIKSIATEQDRIFQQTLRNFKKSKNQPITGQHRSHRSSNSFKIYKSVSPKSSRSIFRSFAGNSMAKLNTVHTMRSTTSFASSNPHLNLAEKKLRKCLSPRSTFAPHIAPPVNRKTVERKKQKLEKIEEKRRELDKLLDSRFQLKVKSIGVKSVGQAFLKMSKMDKHSLQEFKNNLFLKEEERMVKSQHKKPISGAKANPIKDFLQNIRNGKKLKKNTEETEGESTQRYLLKLEEKGKRRDLDLKE